MSQDDASSPLKGSSISRCEEPSLKRRRQCGEVAVGAVIAPLHLVQAVRKMLKREHWLKTGVCVVKFPQGTDMLPSQTGGGEMAVHLNHAGALELARCFGDCSTAGRAIAIDSEQERPAAVPQDLWDLIRARAVSVIPGLRVGAQVHKDGQGGTSKLGEAQQRHPTAVEPPDGRPGTQQRFTFAELFAGIGGFGCALEAIGGRCTFASEIDKAARDIYRQNFRGPDLLVGDITEVNSHEVPAHDLLTAGFCCQSFSRAGDEQGLDDSRGILFYEVIRVLQQSRPPMLLLENVSNLLEHDGGSTIGTVLDLLRKSGYIVTLRVINSSTLLPQHRQRVYLVGFRDDLQGCFQAFRWPAIPLLDRTIRDILQTGPEAKECSLSDHQWQKIRDSAIYKEDPGRRMAMLDGSARTLMASYKRGYYMHSEFVFEDGADEPPRFYTPRECARLMGFPEDFKGLDSNRAYHHLGNAVCPPIVAAIAESMLRAFELHGNRGEQGMRQQGHVLEPALRLLKAASSLQGSTEESANIGNDALVRVALHSQVDLFLSAAQDCNGLAPKQGHAGSVPGMGMLCHTGYSADAREGGGLPSIFELLCSNEPRAQMAALRDLARLSSKSGLHMAPMNRKLIANYPGMLQRLLELIAISAGGASATQSAGSGDCSNQGQPALTGNSSMPRDQRARGIETELRRLALVAVTNLAAGQDVQEELAAAGAEGALVKAISAAGDGLSSINLQSQAQVALRMMQGG